MGAVDEGKGEMRMMLSFLVWGLQLTEVPLIEKEDTTGKLSGTAVAMR